MKISSLGEFGLIEQIRKSAARDARRVRIGIGDDAAALVLSPVSALLATTDMLLEGVHFDLATTDLFSLGWKSAAVNLSDIAAMGGAPRFCLTALGIPPSLTVEDIREFYRGVNACLKKFGAVLAGGDTCRSRAGLVISVSVLGETEQKRIITRSGARPGDRIFVTGTLGDSAAGLELVRSAECGVRSKKPDCRRLIEKHLKPFPRVAEGRKLAKSGTASAMIDVSDGLSSDLGHICEQSRVGAEIIAANIPLSTSVMSLKTLERPALAYALSGGEDYELLFTVSPDKLRKFRSLRLDASEIGVITRGRAAAIIGGDGRKAPLRPSGYDHFGGRARDRRPRR
jgi:thiamine-monophosphate kinase